MPEIEEDDSTRPEECSACSPHPAHEGRCQVRVSTGESEAQGARMIAQRSFHGSKACGCMESEG